MKLNVMLQTCALILLLTGCSGLGGRTNVPLPPLPTTPGARMTDAYICIPHGEAAELQLWMEYAAEHCILDSAD